MHESPRVRRLRSDLGAMERLRSESSVLTFKVDGTPAQHYRIEFRGKSLARFQGKVSVREHHEVEIKLGAGYPRTMPEIRWLTPLYHPNISEIGMVCLGGYGTHWVPSLNLDELCVMLWDMARFHNYDVRSPYNREAALWVANQSTFRFPMDNRPLRDLRLALGRVESPGTPVPAKAEQGQEPGSATSRFVKFLKGLSDDRAAVTDPSPSAETITASTSEFVAEAPAADVPNGLETVVETVEPASENEAELILTESIEDLGLPAPAPAASHSPFAEAGQAVRLRAADEEIVFID